ncbi:hypothetical protein [Streptomyces sp. V1I6]|uniref:hypothetical protein n=1 Tax=Streptomyces sp. V1I6 TaxID=3042273 RepID=UPI00277FA60A|nr:hypothetical protein [Streptomyces sp. V1I6]MDQ0847642.1 hypothetical protein [Streptomyces sp. V1I6]
MLSSFFSRLLGKPASVPAAAPMPGDYRACDELGAITRPFSPLVGELLALYCHTRPIGALSQTEDCRDEYQMTARSIIHHILEGWRNQTDGRGTIDDLSPDTARIPNDRNPDHSNRRTLRSGGAPPCVLTSRHPPPDTLAALSDTTSTARQSQCQLQAIGGLPPAVQCAGFLQSPIRGVG